MLNVCNHGNYSDSLRGLSVSVSMLFFVHWSTNLISQSEWFISPMSPHWVYMSKRLRQVWSSVSCCSNRIDQRYRLFLKALMKPDLRMSVHVRSYRLQSKVRLKTAFFKTTWYVEASEHLDYFCHLEALMFLLSFFFTLENSSLFTSVFWGNYCNTSSLWNSSSVLRTEKLHPAFHQHGGQ